VNYIIDPINPNHLLVKDSSGSLLAPCAGIDMSWITQLSISGPVSLAVSTTGSYTVTAKDYLGNSLSTFTDTITIQTTDTNGDKQTISVPITNGTGTFQFSAATAATYVLQTTGQTEAGIPYDCNALEVVVS